MTSPDLDRLSDLMADSLAAELPAAQRTGREGATVALGMSPDTGVTGDMLAECAVVQAGPASSGIMVELRLVLRGGPFGRTAVHSCWVELGESEQQAVVRGIRTWVSGPYRALCDALAGATPTVESDIGGRRCRVYVSPAQARGAGTLDPATWPADWDQPLVCRLIDSQVLPILEPDVPVLVSCFAAHMQDGEQVCEITLNGRSWPFARSALAGLPWPAGGQYLDVRELAVIWPEGAGSASWNISDTASRLPSGPLLERTLAGLAAADAELARFGSATHRYQLAQPLGEGAVTRLEARGAPLPEDYRRFITTVGASGAGPFYGLLPPDTDAQLASMRGWFPHEDSWMPPEPDGEPDGETDADPDAQHALGSGVRPDIAGTLMLAHLGCGYAALLVVGGPARGQVWIDLGAAGMGLHRTHDSFTDWYLDWVHAAVTGRSMPAPIPPGCCGLMTALSGLLEREERARGMEPGTIDPDESIAVLSELPDAAIATVVRGVPYFDDGDPVDPCPLCTAMTDRFEIREQAMVSGVPPRHARRPASPRRSLWQRIFSRGR